jgi:hypothetical protein
MIYPDYQKVVNSLDLKFLQGTGCRTIDQFSRYRVFRAMTGALECSRRWSNLAPFVCARRRQRKKAVFFCVAKHDGANRFIRMNEEHLI